MYAPYTDHLMFMPEGNRGVGSLGSVKVVRPKRPVGAGGTAEALKNNQRVTASANVYGSPNSTPRTRIPKNSPPLANVYGQTEMEPQWGQIHERTTPGSLSYTPPAAVDLSGSPGMGFLYSGQPDQQSSLHSALPTDMMDRYCDQSIVSGMGVDRSVLGVPSVGVQHAHIQPPSTHAQYQQEAPFDHPHEHPSHHHPQYQPPNQQHPYHHPQAHPHSQLRPQQHDPHQHQHQHQHQQPADHQVFNQGTSRIVPTIAQSKVTLNKEGLSDYVYNDHVYAMSAAARPNSPEAPPPSEQEQATNGSLSQSVQFLANRQTIRRQKRVAPKHKENTRQNHFDRIM